MKSRGVLFVVMIVCLFGRARAATPDEVLQSKGLTKQGNFYLLADDLKLPESLKVVRQTKKTLDDNTRKRNVIQAQMKDARNLMARLDQQYRDTLAALKPGLTDDKHNQIVAQVKTLESQMRDGQKYLDDRQAELKNLVPPTDDYISAVMSLADKMDATAKQYEELAKDKEVATALDELNKKPPHVSLGPSPQFAQELKPTRKARDAVASAAIPLDIEDGVRAFVNVTLNGNVAERLQIDTGADLVTLTPDTAARLGVKSGKDDKLVQLSLADGSKSHGRLVTLKSVRIGQFTASDVEAVILPPEAKSTSGLLGGTFLQHFVYRIDMTAALLHLSPNSNQVTSEAPAKGSATSRPTTVALSQPAVSPGKEIDLLAKVELPRDVLAGKWTKTASGLVSEAGRHSRIKLTYAPPAEYDFIVEFTRTDGNESVSQLCAAGESTFQWEMGGWSDKFDGFQVVEGNEVPHNSTQHKSTLKNGRRTRSVIQVRKNSVTALIDGKEVSKFEGKLSDLSQQDGWSVGPNALGVGCWESRVVFHKIAVVEMNAAGKPVAGSGELIDTMTGDTGRKEDGAIVLHDGERIRTAQSFAVPATVKIVAMDDDHDLRIGYACDQIIFNWRDNPKELRIDGGPGAGRHKPGAGKIATKKWVEVTIDVKSDEMVISVDGQQRHRIQADFSKIDQPVALFPAVGSTIRVKSVKVERPG